jgi:hypothetical protein
MLYSAFTDIDYSIVVVAIVSSDSSVGIATRYAPGCPEIESQSERGFPHRSRPAPGPNQPPVQGLPGLFCGKTAEA